ncbi:MAG: cation transporting ATPase C-terminal domain-containing protein [Thomasclavelia ramosa]
MEWQWNYRSEVSKDAAAMVLTDDNFATIIKAVENGRNVYANIKDAIQFLLSGNFGGILAVLYASIMALPVPFAPVHLLFINLLTDSLPAIALGLEPHNAGVMKENHGQ